MKIKRKVKFFLLFIFDIAKLAVIAFVIVWPIHYFVFQPFYVIGPSMEPNFYDRDYLIVSKIIYRLESPERGQVIIFHPPANDKDFLIKRVVGLPGEKISIEKGLIYVTNSEYSQGERLKEEDYLAPGLTTPGKIEVRLGDDEYYALGDNRSMSLDSRSFGPVSRDRIVGRAIFRGWPFDTFGLISVPNF